MVALLLPMPPPLRMVFPDRRTLPFLVDAADVRLLPLLLFPRTPSLGLLPLPPVAEGIPRSSKAAANFATLGLAADVLPPLLAPDPFGLAWPRGGEGEAAELAELAALGDVGTPVPAIRFLRAARAASAAAVSPPSPPPPAWRSALRFLREAAAAAEGEVEGEVATAVAVEFIVPC